VSINRTVVAEYGDPIRERVADGAGDRRPLISLVVPVWRDDAGRVDSMWRGLAPAPPLAGRVELVVAAAEADEAALAALEAGLGAVVVRCPQAGRGAQLHAGALRSRGELLLFQHVDTPLRPEHLEALAALAAAGGSGSKAAGRGWVGGAYHRDLAGMFPLLRPLRGWVRWWHQHAGLLLGDQSVFVTRESYLALGGFRPLPLMEDVDFSRRLRRLGPLRLIDPPVRHSLRRFDGRNWWQRQRLRILNGWLLLLFACGADPARLHARYYRARGNTAGS